MFESHGRFVVCRQGNILKVDATGPFNHEAVENYQEDVVDAIKYLDEPWGQLILMHENCLYTPQAAQAMYHFAKLRRELGLVAIALVFIDKNAMLIVQDKISDFYQGLKIPYQFFYNREEGTHWLKNKLLSASQSQQPTSMHL